MTGPNLTPWNTILWNQVGASIDMLENAIAVCPEELWNRSGPDFWHMAYHTLFFLDLQLFGSLEGFAPPEPFDLSELDADCFHPRPYTKHELLNYLQHCREKCYITIAGLTEDNALRPCRSGSFNLPFAEALLHGMRHVQHHTAQLNLLLRQNRIAAPKWVSRTSHQLKASVN